MILKPGVKIEGARPELIIGLMVADTVYARYNTELVVTSIMEGRHMTNSKHYDGLAADLRIKNVLAVRHMELLGALKNSLGWDFDVVLESDHIHIEYDPK